jgi:kanamycin kinase
VTVPPDPIAPPEYVVDLAAGREVTPVWLNDLGGVTFSLGDEEFVKVYPHQHAALLVTEAERMRWAIAYHPVPKVLSSGPGWLHTAALPGRSATDPHWTRRPRTSTRAIGEGLRRMHDALPVDACPFGPPSWLPDDAPPAEVLVVCHGDARAPNTMIGDDAEWTGQVDLGDLGVADRWADLAVASMSLDWNYEAGLEPELLDAYEIDADEERLAYYRARYAEQAGSPR